jgi:hypothetical protein
MKTSGHPMQQLGHFNSGSLSLGCILFAFFQGEVFQKK